MRTLPYVLYCIHFKGQVHIFAERQIKSHSSCRTSAILKYFCPLLFKVCTYLEFYGHYWWALHTCVQTLGTTDWLYCHLEPCCFLEGNSSTFVKMKKSGNKQCTVSRGQKFPSSARNYEWNLEMTSNSPKALILHDECFGKNYLSFLVLP